MENYAGTMSMNATDKSTTSKYQVHPKNSCREFVELCSDECPQTCCEDACKKLHENGVAHCREDSTGIFPVCICDFPC